MGSKIAYPKEINNVIGIVLEYIHNDNSVPLPSKEDQHNLVLNALENEFIRLGKKVVWPLVIKMPCDHKMVFLNRDEVPMHNIPCPCEDPKHIILKIIYAEG